MCSFDTQDTVLKVLETFSKTYKLCENCETIFTGCDFYFRDVFYNIPD